jgi:hypothetical protein
MVILGANTISSVTVGNASTLIAAANPARKHLRITNLSSEIVYLSEGAAAESAKGIPLAPVASGSPVETGIYETGTDGLLFTGAVYGITASGSKAVAVKES